MAGNAEKHLVIDKRIARNWADLPKKILVLIAKGLSCSNQLRFRGVCKSWRSIRMIEILAVNGLPCLVRFSCVDDGNGGVISECLISLPTDQSTIPIFHKIDRDDKQKFVGAKVVDSKAGWLFCISKRQSFTFLFLYNPFTKEIIVLPDLDVVNHHSHTFLYVATSSSPSSHDCIFFAAYQSSSYFFVNSCCKGDNGWIINRFPTKTPISRILCTGNALYCLSLDETLHAFSMEDHRMTVLGEFSWKRLSKSYFFEYHRELLLAFFQDQDAVTWRVFRFDRSQVTWKEVRPSENLTIFIGCGYSSGLKSEVAWGLGEPFKGSFCYLEHPNIVFHSFKDGRVCKLPSPYSRQAVYNGYL
ncbi:F-box domain [Dillenia turbinata]|uniref:F-box domain n=1 Tax=Dillenia turbinata TaxID=194707 RepID=A0AAN8UIU4_9MAGN